MFRLQADSSQTWAPAHRSITRTTSTSHYACCDALMSEWSPGGELMCGREARGSHSVHRRYCSCHWEAALTFTHRSLGCRTASGVLPVSSNHKHPVSSSRLLPPASNNLNGSVQLILNTMGHSGEDTAANCPCLSNCLKFDPSGLLYRT